MILCIGTTPVLQRTFTLARLNLDQVNRAISTDEYASGKSINVARVLHTLGEEVIATGFLGGDSGRFIRDELSGGGLATDFITVEPKTRTCITVIDQSASTVTELVEESREIEKPAWSKLRSRIAELLPKAKVMVLSGSLTPNAPVDFYCWCANRATDSAINTVIDASGEPLRRALAARPLIVKPNRAELAKTLDTPIESDAALRDAIKQLIDLGPHWAVITEGKAGAIVSNASQFWRVRSPKVEAVNPIGSGDSLAAGLASAISRGQRMPDACTLAVACGAANAMTARAGTVRPDDVAELLEKTTIDPW